MPWKLIFYLVIIGLILVFIGLNLGNTTDISLGFVTYESVPVFMGLFVAFFFGVAVTIPIAVKSSSRKTKERSDRRANRQEQKQEKKQKRLDRRKNGAGTSGISKLLPGGKKDGGEDKTSPGKADSGKS